VRLGDGVERLEDAKAALVQVFLDRAGAGGVLQVGIAAVLAREKA